MNHLQTFLFSILLSPFSSVAAPILDLSGTWSLHLPAKEQWSLESPATLPFPDTIQLPGMLTAQGFGSVPSFETRWTGSSWTHPEMFPEYQRADNFKFPFFLQPPHYYVGPAWYQKTITIPDDWATHTTQLFLERAHWQTTIWLDGQELAKGEALGTPQILKLGAIAPGDHTLIIRVDNRLQAVHPGSSAHSVSDHTQGNWNGIVGRLELQQVPSQHLNPTKISTSATGQIQLELSGTITSQATGDRHHGEGRTFLPFAHPKSRSHRRWRIPKGNHPLLGQCPALG